MNKIKIVKNNRGGQELYINDVKMRCILDYNYTRNHSKAGILKLELFFDDIEDISEIEEVNE